MIIAWDFDGVLNRNHDGQTYVWEDEFAEAVGRPAAEFGSFVFGRSPKVITGQIGILDRLREWTGTVECRLSAEDILSVWLELDARPDAEMLAVVDALNAAGRRQIIATNNEARRAAYIGDQMGMADRMERIFASGSMGVAKPDLEYFDHVAKEIQATPQEFFFVDDLAANVEAAKRAGWRAFHFSPATRDELIDLLTP